MKISKKKLMIIVVTYVCILSLFFIFDNDRYIHENIIKIDQADSIIIISEKGKYSYEFDDKMNDLVSYGGYVIKVDNPVLNAFKPYSNILDEINLTITYKKGDSTLGIAKVFNTKDESDEYILYMNNVYWSTNSNINDLLDLIQ